MIKNSRRAQDDVAYRSGPDRWGAEERQAVPRRWRRTMIRVTRLDGSSLYVNSDLIEFVESTPDTVVSLTTGHKLIVREAPTVLLQRVEEYQRHIRETSSWLSLTTE